jgi:hypothetical protein
MFFRVLCGVMAALFLFSVVVQVNDPDPVQWMAMYAASAVLSALAARRRPGYGWPWPALVGLVALGWGLFLWPGVREPGAFEHMADAWEMKDASIEQARETTALLVTAGWMAILAIAARIRRAGPAASARA